MKFSANLGYLWTERPLPDAIHAAAEAGFDAVECHWPYDTPPDLIRAALRETGLLMLSLNTRRGHVGDTPFGLAALPGHEGAARTAIDEATSYAADIGAGMVHVMAGNATGPDAARVFTTNLTYALEQAQPLGISILIEPLNAVDAPGYFLSTTAQAIQIIEDIGTPHIKLMFDCYHIGLTEGDVVRRFEACLPHIGHVQIAGVPGRGAPDDSDLDYPSLLKRIKQLGWARPIGAEYRVTGETKDSLSWLPQYRLLYAKPLQNCHPARAKSAANMPAKDQNP